MNCRKPNKLKIDPFQPKTTYLHDYRILPIEKQDSLKKSRSQIVPEKLQPKPLYENHETFYKLKNDAYLPFNLLWPPKPILQTHPKQKLQQLNPILTNKEEIIKSRPKVYMVPACCMDDIPDKNMRKILCDSMYTTEWRKAEKEGTSNFQQRIPSIHETITNDVISLKVDLYPPIETRYKKKAKEWDDQQSRAYSDTTKVFWINKDPPVKCGACTDPLKQLLDENIKTEITNAISNNRLRLAYDLPLPNYAGYRPQMANGISLKQKHIPVTHPMLTVSQAIASRFIKE